MVERPLLYDFEKSVKNFCLPFHRAVADAPLRWPSRNMSQGAPDSSPSRPPVTPSGLVPPGTPLGRPIPDPIAPITPSREFLIQSKVVNDPSDNSKLTTKALDILERHHSAALAARGSKISVPAYDLEVLVNLITQLDKNVSDGARSQYASLQTTVARLASKVDALSTAATSNNTSLSAKIDRIETGLKDVPTTYAQAAAAHSPVPTQPSVKHNPYVPKRDPSVEITLRGPKPPARVALFDNSTTEIVQHVTDTINSIRDLADLGCTIRTVLKLPSGDVRIILSDARHASALVNPRWVNDWVKKVDPTLSYTRPIWRVVAHRVPTSFDPSDEDAVSDWRLANDPIGIQVSKFEWIGKRNPNAKFASMRLSFVTPTAAIHAIKNNLIFGPEFCPVEKARLPPLRCTNCWRFDHSTRACRSSPRCGQCAGNHATDHHEHQCSTHDAKAKCLDDPDHCAETSICPLCRSPDHSAFDPKCPATVKAEAQAKEAFAASGWLFDLDAQPPFYSLPTVIITDDSDE